MRQALMRLSQDLLSASDVEARDEKPQPGRNDHRESERVFTPLAFAVGGVAILGSPVGTSVATCSRGS